MMSAAAAQSRPSIRFISSVSLVVVFQFRIVMFW
jgi:hypothetical protein